MVSIASPLSSAHTHPLPMQSTYLERAVELLDPKAEQKHARNAALWNMAAYTSLVAFSIFAVGATVATGLFMPIYIPITTIALLMLAQNTATFFLKFQKISQCEDYLAKQTASIAEKYRALPTNGAQIAGKLSTMGISLNAIKDFRSLDGLKKFTPLMAQYDYWTKESDAEMGEMAVWQKKGDALCLADTPENTLQGNDARLSALDCEERALKAKTQAAFLLAIIQNPHFTGELDQLCSFKTTPFGARALAARFGDPHADDLLLFKQGGVAPITTRELKEISISELARRIARAMS
jgi:hypothetical protein